MRLNAQEPPDLAPTSAHRYPPVGNYELMCPLGAGGMASVYLARAPNGDRVAVKTVRRTAWESGMHSEQDTMLLLSHQNIVSLLELIKSPKYVFLVLPYADRGDLLRYLLARGPLAEEAARSVFNQILSATEYAHERSIVHRDLKLENVFLQSCTDADSVHVLVGDWGFATHWDPHKRLSRSCGSLHYCSPEIALGLDYIGPEVDVWSLGVILYSMLVARLPFVGDTPRYIVNMICEGFEALTIPDTVSDLAWHLLSQCFKVDPKQRITVTAMRAHPWMGKYRVRRTVGGRARSHSQDVTSVTEVSKSFTALSGASAALDAAQKAASGPEEARAGSDNMLSGLALGGVDPSNVERRDRGRSRQRSGTFSQVSKKDPRASASPTARRQVAQRSSKSRSRKRTDPNASVRASGGFASMARNALGAVTSRRTKSGAVRTSTSNSSAGESGADSPVRQRPPRTPMSSRRPAPLQKRRSHSADLVIVKSVGKHEHAKGAHSRATRSISAATSSLMSSKLHSSAVTSSTSPSPSPSAKKSAHHKKDQKKQKKQKKKTRTSSTSCMVAPKRDSRTDARNPSSRSTSRSGSSRASSGASSRSSSSSCSPCPDLGSRSSKSYRSAIMVRVRRKSTLRRERPASESPSGGLSDAPLPYAVDGGSAAGSACPSISAPSHTQPNSTDSILPAAALSDRELSQQRKNAAAVSADESAAHVVFVTKHRSAADRFKRQLSQLSDAERDWQVGPPLP